jgi:hypothetical protein
VRQPTPRAQQQSTNPLTEPFSNFLALGQADNINTGRLGALNFSLLRCGLPDRSVLANAQEVLLREARFSSPVG